MSLALIRAAIVSTINTVPDIGTVHDYERYARSEEKFRLFYTGAVGGRETLLGWFVRRVATRVSPMDLDDPAQVATIHTWRIRGLMALTDADASEIAFDGLIEALRAAFAADHTLGGAVATTIIGERAGLQLEESEPVSFAGVLCHAARLRLDTLTYE